MKIAIISDVHGNYPALSAVIKDAIQNNVDHFIFAGDYIFDLPYPNEVTELIRGLKNASVIQGNKEGYLKKLSTEDQDKWNLDQMGAAYQTYRELKPDNLSYLISLSDNCFVIRFTGVQEIAEKESTLKDYIHEAIEVEKAGLQVEFKKTAEYTIPEELQKKFDEDTALKTAFEALTPGRQRAYLFYFAQPKQSKTRESRIENSMQQILSGKGLND